MEAGREEAGRLKAQEDDAMTTPKPPWTEAGGAHQLPFMAAASRTMRGDRDLACPRCAAATLRSYFHEFNRDRRTGTFWVWCPGCRTTAHLPRVTPPGPPPPDPFAELSLDDFAALELDPAESLLDRLDRLWDEGRLG
jgi:hypothetical protein